MYFLRSLYAQLDECVAIWSSGEVRCGHTRRPMLPPDIFMEADLYTCPEPDGVSRGGYGEGGVLDGLMRMRLSNTYKPWAWRRLKEGLEKVLIEGDRKI